MASAVLRTPVPIRHRLSCFLSGILGLELSVPLLSVALLLSVAPTTFAGVRNPSTAQQAGDEVAAPAPRDRTVLRLLALYVCWGSAIPAMKLMVDSVPPVGGAALVFLLAGVVLAVPGRGRPRPTRTHYDNWRSQGCCCW